MPTEKTWIILTQQKMLFRFSKEIPSKKTTFDLRITTFITTQSSLETSPFVCLSDPLSPPITQLFLFSSILNLLWLLITTREDIWRQQQQKRQDRYKKNNNKFNPISLLSVFFTIEKENQNYQLRKVNEHWTYSSNSSPYVSSFSVSLSHWISRGFLS